MGMASSLHDSPLLERSHALVGRARRVMPAPGLARIDNATRYLEAVLPKYLARGRGARVWDVDGNEYLDLSMTSGPAVLGYGHAAVDEAVRRQLERGLPFSSGNPLEVELAERLRSWLPATEMLRFGRTLTDVTTAAARLACAYTGRDRVLRLDLSELLDEVDERTACVFVDAATPDTARAGALQELASACRRVGCLLILDETWTLLRLARGGAQQHYAVAADLTCNVHVLANGFPLSVLAGKAELLRLLDNDALGASAAGTDPLSLAAAHATLNELAPIDAPAILQERGAKLWRELDELLIQRPLGDARLVGSFERAQLSFDSNLADPLQQRALVQYELLRQGVLWSGVHSLSLAHGESELEYAREAFRCALDVLVSALRSGDVRGFLSHHGAPSLRKMAR